jgi:hypothetical protein
MKAPDASALLQAWEAHRGAHLIRRALALLDAAWPEIGIQVWSRAPIGERDAWLLQLHETLFGAQLNTVASCPRCGERLESSFTTHDIGVQAPALPEPRSSFRLRELGCDIEYRLPTSDDLLAATEDTAAVSAASIELLRRCIVDVHQEGLPVDPVRLPSAVVARLAAEMQQRDPAAEICIALNCPGCQHAWSSGFDIVSYLWGEIEDWAQRLLADVHVLAGAYGWSERDILALSPTRRQIYLDMVHA